METTLSATQLDAVRQGLLGPGSDELIDLIFRLNLALPLGPDTASAAEAARHLGWITDDSDPKLSPLGLLVADPLREYRFWLDRDRRIHSEHEHEMLVPERYANKSVLEVGSGFGCNLFSLKRRVQGVFVGVEPMAIYRQFTPLLAEREGLEAPEVLAGTGEELPFESNSFDVVYCYSSHQYMDILKAIPEMARVLVPGGQMQIVGGTLDTYLSILVRELIRRPTPSNIMNGVRTTINTLTYQWLGRRVMQPASVFATAAPVYPLSGVMCKWLSGAGLELRSELIKRVGKETCFMADKPGRS